MIRGAQKKMIVVRTHDSRMFEEAYFVMRRDTDEKIHGEDMLWEANRIIEGSLAGSGKERRYRELIGRRIKRAGWFLLGVLCGGGSVGLLWLLL